MNKPDNYLHALDKIAELKNEIKRLWGDIEILKKENDKLKLKEMK